jgi:replicative DNA helicase
MDRVASVLERVPPQNLEAEQSTLGAMMIDRAAIEKASEILKPEDFYRPAHQEIFDALCTLTERDEAVDLITIQEELRGRNKLNDVGGIEYLMILLDAVPSASNVEYYAKIVEEKAILRRLIAAGTEVIGLAHEEVTDIDATTDKAERAIFSVTQRRMGNYFTPLTPLIMSNWDWVEQRYREKGSSWGLTTGFQKFDYITSGLQKADMIIIAGRPSMGKTSLMLDIGMNAAIKGKATVAIFSIEMSKEQLAQRMVCSRARVNAHRLRTGFFEDAEWERLARASNELWGTKMFIDDTTDITTMAMRAKCRRLRAEHGLDLVVIDYLQLLKWHRNTDNRNQELSEIARAVKGLARELEVPVVIGSQLSRAPEKREDKRPMLSDLRESGSIEAEADLVALLFRPDYYVKREIHDAAGLAGVGDKGEVKAYDVNQREVEPTEVILAKHRNGPTGTIRLAFVKDFASFEDLYEDDEE